MSQRRSYPNSGDFNLDDLFRPEPGQQPQQPPQPQQAPPQPYPPQGPPPQPYEQPPVYEQPQPYAGVPQQQAAETQYLPPYPTADPQGTQAAQPQQPPQGPPQPPQSPHDYPTALASPAVQLPPQGPPPQPYEQPSPFPNPAQPAFQPAYQPQQPYSPMEQTTGIGYQEDGGRRSSNKPIIIGGVVAGCVAAAVLVAVLMSGDDEKPSAGNKPTTPAATGTANGTGTASASPDASASAAPALSPEAKAQAKALSELLATANDSRQAVVNAVGSARKCEKLPESQQALSAAAGQRKGLLTKLAELKTDQLPSGAQLVEQLNQAWQASATADEEYAAWVGDAQAPGACDPKKQDNAHYKNAVAASGTATTAKNQASTLWNAIAGQAGLANVAAAEL